MCPQEHVKDMSAMYRIVLCLYTRSIKTCKSVKECMNHKTKVFVTDINKCLLWSIVLVHTYRFNATFGIHNTQATYIVYLKT